MTGFTWWINIGVFKGYVPNETIFPTLEDAINDAIEEYPYEYIGVDKVKEDDGWITIISTVKKCDKTIWLDEEEN